MVKAWEEKLKKRQGGGEKVGLLGSKESLLKRKVLDNESISEGAFIKSKLNYF
jgi:hypothetical protein